MYREPGREADPEIVPTPPARALLSPVGWGLLAVLFLAAPTSIANLVLQPDGDSSVRTIRLVPWVDTFEAVLGLVVLGTFLVVVAQVVRRVAPQWAGISTPAKVLYLVALVAVQAIFVVGGEAALFESHGGLELLGPSLKTTVPGPGGKTAYVLGGGLGCGLQLFVADHPISPTMHRVQQVTGHCKADATTRVEWGSDGNARMVDPQGIPLADEPSRPFFFGWGGGC